MSPMGPVVRSSSTDVHALLKNLDIAPAEFVGERIPALSGAERPIRLGPGTAVPPRMEVGMLLALLRRGGLRILWAQAGAPQGEAVVGQAASRRRSDRPILGPRLQAQARSLCLTLHRHRVVIGRVSASPDVACREFAELAFGRVEVRSILADPTDQDEAGRERVRELRSAIGSPIRRPNLNMVIGDTRTIRAATQVDVAAGQALLVLPRTRQAAGSNAFTVIGVVSPEDWQALADQPLVSDHEDPIEESIRRRRTEAANGERPI